jgi:hypothetical protein
MGIKETLDEVGKYVAIFLAIILLIQFLWVWGTDCKNPTAKDFDVSKCITGLIFLIIPTEVSIAQTFQSAPLILLVLLSLYWLFVAPHEK